MSDSFPVNINRAAILKIFAQARSRWMFREGQKNEEGDTCYITSIDCLIANKTALFLEGPCDCRESVYTFMKSDGLEIQYSLKMVHIILNTPAHVLCHKHEMASDPTFQFKQRALQSDLSSEAPI